MVLIDIEKAGQAILDFIGSDQYKKIVDCQGSSVEGAFLSGMSIAYCVMSVNCDKYVAKDDHEKGNPFSTMSAINSMINAFQAKEPEEEGCIEGENVEDEGTVQEAKEE